MHPSRDIMRSSRNFSTMGFSLMEMLVVVSMIGIMSLFAWPKVVTIYNQSQVRSARTAARNLFEAARINARMHSATMRLNRAGDVLWITNQVTSAPVGGALNVGAEFKVSTRGLVQLDVDPRGLTRSGGLLVFSRGNALDSLVISGYGRVTR
jgi:prepilin-type N-terminal cleavage/methylation domain-containing protein